MSGGLMWNGLDDLKAALRRMPLAIRDDARAIVIEAGERAETSVIQAYPRGPTGNLRGGVRLQDRTAGLKAVARLHNRAPHASIFERGTVPRRTRRGWPRGTMPEGKVFIPTMVRVRDGMYGALKQLVVDYGAVAVRGDA